MSIGLCHEGPVKNRNNLFKIMPFALWAYNILIYCTIYKNKSKIYRNYKYMRMKLIFAVLYLMHSR